MSVYSGFVTRQIEQSYNSLLETLLSALEKRLLAFYYQQSIPEGAFTDLLKRTLTQMAVFERQKYLPPKFSENTKELAMFLGLAIPSNDNIPTKKVKGKDTSNKNTLLSEHKQKEAIIPIVMQNNINNLEKKDIRNQDTIQIDQNKQLLSRIASLNPESQKGNNSNWISELSFGEPQKCVFDNARNTQEQKQQQNGSLRRTPNEILPQHPSLIIISESRENQKTPQQSYFEMGSKMNTMSSAMKNTNYLSINNREGGSAIQEEEEEELSFQKESGRDLNNDQLPIENDQDKDNKRRQKRATTTKRQRKRNLLLNQVYSTEEIQIQSKRSKSLQKGTKPPEIIFNHTRVDQSINKTNNLVNALKDNSLKNKETSQLENEDKYDSIDSHKTISSNNKQRAVSLYDAFAQKSNDIPVNSSFMRQKAMPKNEKQTKHTNNSNSNITANRDIQQQEEENNNIATKLTTNNDSSIVGKQHTTNNSGVFFPQHTEKQSDPRQKQQYLIETIKHPSSISNQQTVSDDTSSVKNSSILNTNNNQIQQDTGQSTFRSFSTEKSKYSASQIYQKANFELQKKSGMLLDTEHTHNLWSPTKQHFTQLKRRQEALSQLWPLSNCNEMYSQGYCSSSSSSQSNNSHVYTTTNKSSSHSKRGQPSILLRQVQRTSTSFSSTQSTAKKENNNIINDTSEKEQDYICSSIPTKLSLPLTLAQMSNRMATTPSNRTKEIDITY